MKICIDCNMNKSLLEFSHRGNNKFRAECKSCACIRRRTKNSLLSHEDKQLKLKEKREYCNEYNLLPHAKTNRKEYNKKRAQTINGKFSMYKLDAKRRGVDFSISKLEFTKFWREPCTYCCTSIETIGLDRIDNHIGYELSNITSCCALCNRIKNNLSFDEFKSHINKIINHMTLVLK